MKGLSRTNKAIAENNSLVSGEVNKPYHVKLLTFINIDLVNES